MRKITDSKILTEKNSESSVSQCTDTKVAEMGKWELENGEKNRINCGWKTSYSSFLCSLRSNFQQRGLKVLDLS